MLSCNVPDFIRCLADRYKDIFANDQYSSYSGSCALLSYFLLGAQSLSELARRCPWTPSVSALSRQIPCFQQSRFMKRLRFSILRRYKQRFLTSPEDFCWAIDDTANPKYGKNSYRSHPWHSSSGPYFGQKIMVLALIDMKGGFAIPVAYLICPKKEEMGYISGPDAAVALLKSAKESGFPNLPVTMDSWFDSTELMAAIEALGMTYVGEAKSKRKCRCNPCRFVPWSKLADLFGSLPRLRLKRHLKGKSRGGLKSYSQKRVYIRNRKSMVNMIAVYNRFNGKKAFGYYCSTDLTMSGERIWELSRARWKIEVMFRDLKQHLSFGKLPCCTEAAAHLAVCLPFMLYVELRLNVPKETMNNKATSTIGDQVDRLREKSLMQSITMLIDTPPHFKTVVTKLRSRRQSSRLNRKPVDQSAEAA